MEGGTCDRVGCPPNHVTSLRRFPCTVYSHYHYYYVLPRASDQLQGPRPTPAWGMVVDVVVIDVARSTRRGCCRVVDVAWA